MDWVFLDVLAVSRFLNFGEPWSSGKVIEINLYGFVDFLDEADHGSESVKLLFILFMNFSPFLYLFLLLFVEELILFYLIQNFTVVVLQSFVILLHILQRTTWLSVWPPSIVSHQKFVLLQAFLNAGLGGMCILHQWRLPDGSFFQNTPIWTHFVHLFILNYILNINES